MASSENEHKAALLSGLREVPNDARVAFAAACAQRVVPFYAVYCKKKRRDPAALARILERLWAHVLGDAMSPKQTRAMLTRCAKLFPDDEATFERDCAESAVAAVTFTIGTLECAQEPDPTWQRPYERTGGPDEAACAAGRVDEAIESFVRERAERPTRFRREDEHPAFEAEHTRQLRDLAELRNAAPDSVEAYARLRDRAMREHGELFSLQWRNERPT